MSTRTTLRRDLSDLKQKIYELGEKCIEVASLYNSLLEQYSENLESRLIDLATAIKDDSETLHDQCFMVLTLQQPLIKDLRFVIGSLQVVLDIEKITDLYLTNTKTFSTHNIGEILHENIKVFGQKIEELIKVSLLSYLSSNVTSLDQAKSIYSEITLNHDLLYKKLLTNLANSENKEEKQAEAILITNIRTLEKAADLAFDIAHQAKYIVEGKTKS